MTPNRPVRRYRSNPVEMAVFSVVVLILVNSVYHLFYDHSDFSQNALVTMNSNPISEGRKLASVTQPLANLDIRCDDSVKELTSANKLRLKGPLCGAVTENSGSNLIKASIVNTSNQFNATVFTDISNGKFSTDYIPLITGENLIRFEFAYEGGKTISQDVHITRN